MIDVRRLREDLDGVKTALARRHIDTSDVDRAAGLHEQLRQVTTQRDDIMGRVNAISKQVGHARRSGDTAAA